jgi:hypothetical protein
MQQDEMRKIVAINNLKASTDLQQPQGNPIYAYLEYRKIRFSPKMERNKQSERQ